MLVGLLVGSGPTSHPPPLPTTRALGLVAGAVPAVNLLPWLLHLAPSGRGLSAFHYVQRKNRGDYSTGAPPSSCGTMTTTPPVLDLDSAAYLP